MEEDKRSPRWVILGGEGRRFNDDSVGEEICQATNTGKSVRKNESSSSVLDEEEEDIRK